MFLLKWSPFQGTTEGCVHGLRCFVGIITNQHLLFIKTGTQKCLFNSEDSFYNIGSGRSMLERQRIPHNIYKEINQGGFIMIYEPPILRQCFCWGLVRISHEL